LIGTILMASCLELTEMVISNTTTQLSSKIVSSYQVVSCFLGEILYQEPPETQAKSLNEA
jgi:hypothetical protein